MGKRLMEIAKKEGIQAQEVCLVLLNLHQNIEFFFERADQ